MTFYVSKQLITVITVIGVCVETRSDGNQVKMIAIIEYTNFMQVRTFFLSDSGNDLITVISGNSIYLKFWFPIYEFHKEMAEICFFSRWFNKNKI